MIRPKPRALIVAALLLWLTCSYLHAAEPQPTVILVSIDGFRYDYPEKTAMPVLRSLIAEGTRAALIPQFPTLTFPNHYAIVTGLAPEHNGIVANRMYDPALRQMFKISDPVQVTDGRWWGGEPIWVTAEKQGEKAATLFWPGSEAEIEGVRPSYFLKFDEKMSNADRVKQVLAWLDLPPEQRPALLTLYFDEVDTVGHDYGPNSPQLKAAIRDIDKALGLLLAGLRQRGIEKQVNLVIVSDHGMAETSCKRTIDLRAAVKTQPVTVAEHGAILTVYGDPAPIADLMAKLRKSPHLTTYGKSETPLRWNYRDNARIAEIVAVADEGWSIMTAEPRKRRGCTGGNHGYDNDLHSMYGIFIAHGPAFEPGTRLPAFDNIDVHELLIRLLNLRPVASDGSIAPLERVLK